MNRRTPAWVGQPQEIPDAGHEQLAVRVCAIDVAKIAGKVCARVPHPEQGHRRVCKVWDVAATTNAVSALADQLVEWESRSTTTSSKPSPASSTITTANCPAARIPAAGNSTLRRPGPRRA